MFKQPCKLRSCLSLDELESRTVPTVSLTLPGVLQVWGDPAANDQMCISRQDQSLVIQVNGTTTTYDYSAVTLLDVRSAGPTATVTIDFTGGNVIPSGGLDYAGAAGAVNTLVLRGQLPTGPFANEVHTATGPHDGSINLDGSTITYSNLTPIEDTTPAASVTYNGTSSSEAINIIDGPTVGGVATTEVNSGTASGTPPVPTFEKVYFANKTDVTVNGGGGVNAFTVNNPHPGAGLSTLNVRTNATQGNAVYVLATPATVVTFVYGQGTDETCIVSSNSNPDLGNTDGIQGKVEISIHTGGHFIVSNFAGDGKPGVNFLGGPFGSVIYGLAPAEIDYFGGADALVRGSGTHATAFLIQGDSVPTTVVGGAGDDYFNISGPVYHNRYLGFLGSPLTVDGGGGNNAINVGAINQVADLNDHHISSIYDITYLATGGTYRNGVALLAGYGGTVNVSSALGGGVVTTINSGAGSVNIAVVRNQGCNLLVNDAANLTVTDASGGAVLHNQNFGPGSGTVVAGFLAGPSSFIDYAQSAIYPQAATVVANPDAPHSFVQALYHQFLRRDGSGAELDYWASMLPVTQTQTDVTLNIARSWEARTFVVRSWYQHYLGRPAGNSEEQTWVGLLFQGYTEEQVLAGFLNAPEYLARAGNQTEVLVQNDFLDILGRPADAREIAAWTPVASQYGNAVVASDFLNCQEYRTNVVLDLYDNLLGRGLPVPATSRNSAQLQRVQPSAADVNAWVFSGLDQGLMAIDFAAGPEFYQWAI